MVQNRLNACGVAYRKHAAWEVVQNRVNACGVAYRKRAAWEVVQNRVNTCGVAYRKRAAWEVVQNRVNACGVAYRTVDELKEKLVALKMAIKDQIRDQKITGGGKPIPMPDYENVVVSP